MPNRPQRSPSIDARYSNPDSDPRGPWMASDMTVYGVRPRQIYEFLGHLPPDGRSWRFGREQMQARYDDGQIVQRGNGRPAIKRFLPEQMAEEEPPEAPPVTLPAVIREFSATLARRLALYPAELKDVEWRDLERAVAAACEGLGFETRLTRPAKDGGFDIELINGDEVYLVEVKHWAAPSQVGNAHVRHFAEIVVNRSASRGLLLSTSGFRRSVLAQRLEITPTKVRLGDNRKIVGLCQRYLQVENGLWAPQTQLEELLFLGTL